MSSPVTRLLTALAAALALAGFGAQAADTPVAGKKPQKTAKKANPPTVKLLTGLNDYRSPARRALDGVEPAGNKCQPGEPGCATAYWGSPGKSQPSRNASTESVADETSIPASAIPAENLPSSAPGPNITGNAPMREPGYKFSLKVPVGDEENVKLRANVRSSSPNVQNANDTGVGADWSKRF